MMNESEIIKMKDDIQKKIESLDIKLNAATDEFEFNTFSTDKIRKVAQYNILLEVLRGTSKKH